MIQSQRLSSASPEKPISSNCCHCTLRTFSMRTLRSPSRRSNASRDESRSSKPMLEKSSHCCDASVMCDSSAACADGARRTLALRLSSRIFSALRDAGPYSGRPVSSRHASHAGDSTSQRRAATTRSAAYCRTVRSMTVTGTTFSSTTMSRSAVATIGYSRICSRRRRGT